MRREKFEEILKKVYSNKTMRSQIRLMKTRPSWKKLEEFKKFGIPPEAFFDIQKWLKEEEKK